MKPGIFLASAIGALALGGCGDGYKVDNVQNAAVAAPANDAAKRLASWAEALTACMAREPAGIGAPLTPPLPFNPV